jgi:hypothetical protein
VNEWISVKKRLPKLDQQVLIIRGLYGDYKLARLKLADANYDFVVLPDGRTAIWVGEDDHGYDATHWMPLPEPPAEE